MYLIDPDSGVFETKDIDVFMINKLTRLGEQKTLWAIGSTGMLRIAENGDPVGEKIAFTFKGSPGDVMMVGRDKLAVLVNKEDGAFGPGAFDHKVALIDLKESRQSGTFETRDPGKSRRHTVSKHLGALAASMATLGTLVFIPNSAYPYGRSMASRADGSFLYVYDAYTHEVTIVEVSQGKVSVRVPVNEGTLAIHLSQEGKELLCIDAADVVVDRIDVQSNRKL